MSAWLSRCRIVELAVLPATPFPKTMTLIITSYGGLVFLRVIKDLLLPKVIVVLFVLGVSISLILSATIARDKQINTHEKNKSYKPQKIRYTWFDFRPFISVP